MNYSLNEVEAMAKRAARGAGYSWGLAEEAGKATRWLCAQGLDASAALAGVLEQGLAADHDRHTPQSVNGTWSGPEVLCPLATGALLSDCAGILKTQSIQMEHVAVPVLLVPFAATAARFLKTSVLVNCDGKTFLTDGQNLSTGEGFPLLARQVRIEKGDTLRTARKAQTRAYPETEHWCILKSFAHRTYAPATEASRRLGAGAGLSDND